MMLVKRKWKPHEADEWTKEDWIAVFLSPISYILIIMGLAMTLFLIPLGFILLAGGIIITAIMFWIIDPKLSALSSNYEKKQKEYLEDLEHIQRWEEKE
jgi:amino acid transporter